jgi:hypothetical protein
MKYTLTIEADSATELFDALVASATVYRLSDAEPTEPTEPTGLIKCVAPSPEDYEQAAMINQPSHRATLPTGDDPADVYGPGNGPVGAHRPATQAPTAAAPATDANNMPHDERIHAGSKALNADGTWRKKRGVSDELIRSVEAYAVGNEPVPEPEHMSTYTGAVTHGAITPASVMSRIAALVTSGDKTPAYVQEIAKSCDLTDGIAQIASDSDALQRVVAALQADGVL